MAVIKNNDSLTSETSQSERFKSMRSAIGGLYFSYVNTTTWLGNLCRLFCTVGDVRFSSDFMDRTVKVDLILQRH